MKSNTSKISCKRGFTLIELLVVVLIIGILAAIAMPQYQKAVEKSRVAEALTTLDTLKKAIDVYVLEHGLQNVTFIGKPTEQCPQAQLDIDIPLDCSEKRNYCYGKYHGYAARCSSRYCVITTERWLSEETDDYYALYLEWNQGEILQQLCVYEGKKSEQICNNLSGLGWEPEEN